MNRTLAQERASFALEEVKKAHGTAKFDKLTAGLPAMILQNGFGQTMAFLLAKATKDGGFKEKDSHYQAFRIMVAWLNMRSIVTGSQPSDFMKNLCEIPQSKYLLAQDEALAVLEWVKRYANSAIFSSN
jgi:CRISPR-associated protein Cmr5